MNKRIKELMLEAGYAAPEIAGRAQKFTELIVAECAKVILETPVDYMEIDTMHRIRDSVKQHFRG